MKTFKNHLKSKLKNKQFKNLYDEERELHEIAIKIIETRKKNGLTQQNLADEANITQQQLSKVENGINCNMITFLKVCHALDMKMNLRKNKLKIAMN